MWMALEERIGPHGRISSQLVGLKDCVRHHLRSLSHQQDSGISIGGRHALPANAADRSKLARHFTRRELGPYLSASM